MNDLWQQLEYQKILDEAIRKEIELAFGDRGKKALIAVDTHRVKKYLDFFVVSGSTAEYVVDENFCTCNDFVFRNRECWHILAVKIAQLTGNFDRVDSWYQEKWKN
jgi:predicted nucleic acid-binding Zn finger protein